MINVIENIKIEKLDFTVRTFNCLKRAGIDTVQDIVDNMDRLHTVRNLAERCVDEIKEKIQPYIQKVCDEDAPEDTIEGLTKWVKEIAVQLQIRNRHLVGHERYQALGMLSEQDAENRMAYEDTKKVTAGEKKESSTKAYAWSKSITDDIWRGGPCDSIEECVKEAILEGYQDYDTIAIGHTEQYQVGYVNADQIIEFLQEDASDKVGEVSDDWLDYITKEQREDLEERVLKVVLSWIKDCGEEPTFYRVLPCAEITVKEALQRYGSSEERTIVGYKYGNPLRLHAELPEQDEDVVVVFSDGSEEGYTYYNGELTRDRC